MPVHYPTSNTTHGRSTARTALLYDATRLQRSIRYELFPRVPAPHVPARLKWPRCETRRNQNIYSAKETCRIGSTYRIIPGGQTGAVPITVIPVRALWRWHRVSLNQPYRAGSWEGGNRVCVACFAQYFNSSKHAEAFVSIRQN